MATLNTNIPLMGQNVNYGNALAQGMQAGQQAYNARQSYEADQFRQANASGIMSGDPQALAGLAGYDLDAAQQARVGALNARTAEFKLSAAEASQAAAELEGLMRPLAIAYGKGDQRMFEQALARNPELAGQITWDNFEAIAAETATVYEQLMEVQDANKPDYKFDEKTGRLVMIDPNDPRKSEVIEFGPPQGYRQISGEEAAKMGLDPKKSYNIGPDGKVSAIGGASTTVNVNNGSDIGTIPQGYSAVPDPENPSGYRMFPIPGGPEDTSAAEAAAKESKLTQAEIVLDDIDWVLETQQNSKIPVTGIIGANAQRVPGTVAHDVGRTLDTIRANVGFDKLQAMREASPTGGALGQVSEQENRLLQSVLGNLEQSQTEERFRSNLERLKTVYLDIIHGEGNWSMGADGSVALNTHGGALSDEELFREYGIE